MLLGYARIWYSFNTDYIFACICISSITKCSYLSSLVSVTLQAAAFWKCMNAAEADDEGDDPGALAAVGCLRAISTILESVSKLPNLFIEVEPTLLPIMRRMLTTDGQGMYSKTRS